VNLGGMQFMVAMGICLTLSGTAGLSQTGERDTSHHHGYYLFLAGTPSGCEDCYIPLLLTPKSLEELKKSPTATDCVLITTYERDSIWHYDGLLGIRPSDIDEAERKVRILNRTYRFQEIGVPEILKVLENPSGKIPISRPVLPSKLRPGPDLKELIPEFRAGK
jgi:hypothetical protein